MEDGLRPIRRTENGFETSLNPCCNGRWSQTDGEWTIEAYHVLILVVMEDGLRPVETLPPTLKLS